MSASRRGWSVVSSLWSFFGKTIRSHSKKGPGRRYRLTVESLENRTVPSSTPFLVKDINLLGRSSDPYELVQVGSLLFFTADDGAHGRELWRTDGTSTGLQLVKDILPGPGSPGVSRLTDVNGTLFFAANDGEHGYELWTSDGTEAGTMLVTDLRPGPDGGLASSFSTYYGTYTTVFTQLANGNGTLFFTADDGNTGIELWKSNGSEAGTELVKDIRAGTDYDGNPYGSNPAALTAVGATLFFVADDGEHGYELWKTDGFAGGTELVKDIRSGPEGSVPVTGGFYYTFLNPSLANVNGTLFFTADDGVTGVELWKSNGTYAGTELVQNIRPAVYDSYYGTYLDFGSNPANLTAVGGTLFFTADDGSNGRELWKSNGFAGDTELVKDINPGSSYYGPNSSYASNLTNVNGTLFFTADDGATGSELWQSDGSYSGTAIVKNIRPASSGYYGTYDFGSDPAGLTDVDGTLFFVANDGEHGFELWQSNGSEPGTVLVQDIRPGPGHSVPGYFGYYGTFVDPRLANLNGTLFFAADDGPTGVELWQTDGASAELVGDINTNTFGSYPGRSYFPGGMAEVNGTLFFGASDSVQGIELWKSDGSESGTMLVKDIFPGTSDFGAPASSRPLNLTNVNGTLFFTARDDTYGEELWQSDGTEAGTVLVMDIFPGTNYSGSPRSSYPRNLTNVNGTLYFVARDPSHGWELWQHDASGTTVVDIVPGPSGSYPNSLANVNGTLFFSARDFSNGNELWKHDTSGTAIAANIAPFSSGSYPANLTNVNGILYFTARDFSTGRELWKHDATGTTLVADILGGISGSYPGYLTNVNGKLFFAADDGVHGRELWQSDGTATGTVLVKDIDPGVFTNYSGPHPRGSDPRNLTNVNGTLFFAASDGTNGSELWQSDGTEAGTRLVQDLNPGPASGTGYYSSLANFNGTLFFAANDGNHGYELWALAPAPAAPVITAFADDTGTVGDGLTNDNTLSLSGTAAAGLTIEIFDGDTSLGTTVAGGDGAWSFTTPPLADGPHSFTATATGASHNTSDPSAALAVTIDTSPPAVSVPDLDAASDSGTLSTDNITNNSTPTFSGTAEPGALVELCEGATTLGSTLAAADGTWSIMSAALTDGGHSIAARATDAAGNATTSAALAVTIDTSPPAVSVPDLDAASDTGASSTDNITGSHTPTFIGTAEVGATIELREGATILGTAVASDGTWSITVAAPLADGVHDIHARATDAAGNFAESAPLTVTIVSTLDADIAIKPGGGSVNLASNGVVKVVIRTTATFDAANVNISSVLLAGASAVKGKLQDEDGDGDKDLVLEFRTQDLDLLTLYAELLALADAAVNGKLDANVDTHQLATLSLTGQTVGGQDFEGTGQLEIFLAGKALRDFLQEELAGQI